MGVSESPDIATEMMHSILDDIEGIEFYMDDIGVFSLTWPDHLSLLSTVLGCLENVGFTINPLIVNGLSKKPIFWAIGSLPTV